MQSIADTLRAASPAERLELALRLGEQGLELFRQAHGLDEATARRLLERQRQTGRRPSRCLSSLIG